MKDIAYKDLQCADKQLRLAGSMSLPHTYGVSCKQRPPSSVSLPPSTAPQTAGLPGARLLEASMAWYNAAAWWTRDLHLWSTHLALPIHLLMSLHAMCQSL